MFSLKNTNDQFLKVERTRENMLEMTFHLGKRKKKLHSDVKGLVSTYIIGRIYSEIQLSPNVKLEAYNLSPKQRRMMGGFLSILRKTEFLTLPSTLPIQVIYTKNFI